MIARNILKKCLGFSGLIALCALTLVLAQTDEAPVSTSSNTYAGQDYQEMFSAGSNEILYVNWQEPKGTNQSADLDFFLGAYRFTDGSLVVDLNRSCISNNLYYAISYSLNSEGRAGQPVPPSDSAGESTALYLSLLATNGLSPLIESEELLSSTNIAHFVFLSEGDTENSETNYVILAPIPLKSYPEAAVIQLRSENCSAPQPALRSHSDEEGSGAGADEAITIHDSLLFEDTGYNFGSLEGQQGTVVSNSPYGSSLSNLYNWVTGNTNGSSTNIPGGPPPPPPPAPPGGEEEDQKGKIFIDQARGSDSYTGKLPHAAAGNKGPKKTVHGGLSIAEPGDTIIIKSGNYHEDLKILGRDVRVVISGKVKL